MSTTCILEQSGKGLIIMKAFYNRSEAGKQLAAQLAIYNGRTDVLVLALPRGGVPVAFEIAQALHVPLDVVIVRKLGVPRYKELAMGAIATGGIQILNQNMIATLGISQKEINNVVAYEQQELELRERLYRGNRPAYDIYGRIVILADDGIATGATMQAAVTTIKQQQPARVIIAVPVATATTCQMFAAQGNEVVCVLKPEEFYAISLWYEHFSQTSDKEVHDLLTYASHEQPT